MACSLDPFNAAAVRAMIGMLSFSFSRIILVASTPPISGICLSIKIMSYFFFFTISMAIIPFSAISGSTFQLFNIDFIRYWFTLWSSATSIFNFDKSALWISFSASSVSIVESPSGMGKVKKNLEPVFLVLSTSIWPPIISISCLQIARPNPVPPNLRLTVSSSWLKLSKIIFCFSLSIPIPVSETINLT